MAGSPRLVLSLITGLALAAPVTLGAQAVPRPAPGTATASGGGASGGSVSGPTNSGGGDGGNSSAGRSAPSSVSAPSRAPSRSNPSSRATPPRTAMPGGVISSAVARASVGEGSDLLGGGADLAATRVVPRGRGGVSAPGAAVPRPPGSYQPIYVAYPFYGPWGWYYPWYGPGFGWYMGWAGYNPYWYAGTYWGWGRYGYWYDPFAFGGYYPYYSGGGGGGGSDAPRESRVRMGSIRLKVNPSNAKVYVDGVLYGEAGDFSGLSNHLELEAGRAVLELQADGYETVKRQIVVEGGRTMTERITLPRKK